MQDRMLVAEIAHEKLLDLQRTGVPPRHANQKCICTRATRQAGGFGIEKKPFRWVRHRGPRASAKCFVSIPREQFETHL